MIKFKKGNAMVIGLSDENMKRLSEGKPIKFNMRELDFPDIEVYIFNGRTEHSMALQFKDIIDPLKTIVIDHNAPNN